MAGTSAGFSAKNFRDSIHFAMNMGLPNTESDRATFRWVSVKSWAAQDASVQPYHWDSVPAVVSSKDDVQIPVAVEYQKTTGAGGVVGTGLGDYDMTRAVITALDEDYAKVEGANLVLLGGNVYEIQYVQVVGLFDVSVYQIHCRAKDES